MDDGLVNKNSNNEAFQSTDVLSTAPPPPSEVKVRTMRSDIDSMAKSGGGMPSYTNVKIAGAPAARAPRQGHLIGILVTLIILAIVAAAGWFVYVNFFSGRQATETVQQPGTTQTQATTQSTTTGQAPPNQGAVPIFNLGTTATGTGATETAATGTTPTTPLAHVSFFKTPADQIVRLTLSSTSQLYNQHLLALLSTANKTANLIEIDVKDASGNAASINELLAAQNAEVLNPVTLASDFNPDATFFAYRDSNGFWPGYIIGLAPNQSWLTVESGVQQIESSPNTPNLFLATNIGTPSTDGFTDSTIGSASVRVLPFFGGTIPAYFAYGWTPDHQYLILSTSQAGFAAALTRLGY